MKKISALLLCMFIIISFAGCNDSESPVQISEPDNTDSGTEAVVITTPDKALLNGKWKLTGGETDGMEYTAEEFGLSSTLNIIIKDDKSTADYVTSTEFETKRFSAELEYLETPLYEGCGNEDWSVKFNLINSDFGEDEEFYATLVENDKLLLQQFFPFDGTQGVSYQYYERD